MTTQGKLNQWVTEDLDKELADDIKKNKKQKNKQILQSSFKNFLQRNGLKWHLISG